VQLGGRLRLACRLLAVRVPQAVAAQRRARVLKAAQDKGHRVRPGRLALGGWTVWVTNAPSGLLGLAEAEVLGRLRWQIELLFKLWKSQGGLGQSRSVKPYRVLCEVYAKLLAMVVQHWVLLSSWREVPRRSLRKAAREVRGQALHLLMVLGAARQLRAVRRRLGQALERVCRVEKRRARPAAFQRVAGLPPIAQGTAQGFGEVA
jgi:hypothetical protein